VYHLNYHRGEKKGLWIGTLPSRVVIEKALRQLSEVRATIFKQVSIIYFRWPYS
jgi:hypothetical protein